MLLIDSGKMEGLFLGLGMSDYRVEPSVKPGECIPVELVPVKAKKKKARKG
ncbi:MAG: hypothetical protein KGL35_07990 [Bradyrhizobium sp.]|nr:hypothetical protein [Bradyrhizobium sp.]